MQGEFAIPLDELRIEAPEVGIGLIASLHHSHESVAQLFPRHTEGNDVRAIVGARLLVVQPPHLFETIVERRRGYRVQHADERSRDACIVEEFGHRLEDRRIVVIKADDYAAPIPWPCTRCTRSRSVPVFGRTFWCFLVSRSESSFGVSIPMKTFWKLARPINSMSSSSSARSSEASVKRVSG